ncbi:S-adenosyl-L-methionine-dependent methyltransferase [Glomus cerebriforme]|uniref:S-adenosyl-L-methionine-dependent methyltransferase n=1 Tax=Glomus cerebriforme TaxID=658196 RepID=A0A397TP79_9GLOM|nr:S-adenosyl-L-methionine-dependent methyltransferase [Glomus cerebriforme]
MADDFSSQKPRKLSDSSSLLLEFSKVFRIRKISRVLINNKSFTFNNNNKDSIDKDFIKKLSYELKSINKYTFPSFNDDEFIRLNLEHYLFRFNWQSNFSSPMEKNLLLGGIKVLDIGCGKGIWILDMAKEYHPSNTFIGIDILSIFPNENSRLPNTGFIQCDLINGIPFPDSTFDFVFERFIVCSNFSNFQWNYLFSEMIRVLKPGGYLEIMEYNVNYYNPGPITLNRNAQVFKYLNSKGIDPETTINLIPQMMQSESSLSDFNRQDKVCPIGRWGGELGMMMLNSYETTQKDLNKQFQPGLTKEELEDLITSIINEFDEYKTQIGSFRCFARKKIFSF